MVMVCSVMFLVMCSDENQLIMSWGKKCVSDFVFAMLVGMVAFLYGILPHTYPPTFCITQILLNLCLLVNNHANKLILKVLSCGFSQTYDSVLSN